ASILPMPRPQPFSKSSAPGVEKTSSECSMRLVHPQDLVRFDIGEFLRGSTGPVDLNAGDFAFRTEAKMYSAVAGGHEAHTHRVLVIKDASRSRYQFEFRTHGIARALMPIRINQQPVIAGVSGVHQDTRTLIKRRYN